MRVVTFMAILLKSKEGSYRPLASADCYAITSHACMLPPRYRPLTGADCYFEDYPEEYVKQVLPSPRGCELLLYN